MIILGYSGLHGAGNALVDRPDLSFSERRIFQGMDSAAALIVNGNLTAAVQEERFTGLKADGSFPTNAIRWCLDSSGVADEDVDYVAHGFDYGSYERLLTGSKRGSERYHAVQSPVRQRSLLQASFRTIGRNADFVPVRHHRAHALSAAVGSPFDECLVVVADGMGETDSVSFHTWSNQRLTRLGSLDFRSSLGLFYSLLTMHLGFSPNSDEYMVMGLSGYGDPDRYAAAMEQLLVLEENGRIRAPVLSSAAEDPDREFYRQGQALIESLTFPALSRESPVNDAHSDLAAAAQQRLEQALSHIVLHWVRKTGQKHVAMAGGVALNCLANSKLLNSAAIDRLYVQPAAGDEGTAIGAAAAVSMTTGARVGVAPMPFFGPLEGPVPPGRNWISVPAHLTVALAADVLSKGAIVGWCRGALEFGPRALGNRSILADPRNAETRDRVNRVVKFRQDFRPLAPAVLESEASTWFQLPSGGDLRTMTVTVPVKPSKVSQIPAVTHVDGTARVQVVGDDLQPFADLLRAFEELTQVPVLLNTSLNVKGQPMARTAIEAVATFDSSDLDVLFVGDRVIARNGWDQRIIAGIAT